MLELFQSAVLYMDVWTCLRRAGINAKLKWAPIKYHKANRIAFSLQFDNGVTFKDLDAISKEFQTKMIDWDLTLVTVRTQFLNN